MTEKPDVLSDEEIDQVWPDFPREIIDRECPLSSSELEIIARQVVVAAKVIAQAQRDADVEWFRKLEMQYLDDCREVNEIQIRQDTVREIFEEIEKLTTIVQIGGGYLSDTVQIPVIPSDKLESLKEKYGVSKEVK